MNIVQLLTGIVLHLDKELSAIIAQYGVWTYAIMFVVLFVETGFVVTPFLPGDSLLFAAGAFAAAGSLNLWAIFGLMAVAAILGDTCNYWIGHRLGTHAYNVKWIKREYLDYTREFYHKHGRKTIFLARFVPIVRSFAPFVAGIGRMTYPHFITYNVAGGIAWVLLLAAMGYFFGQIPLVRDHFSLVVLAIVVLSTIPAIIEAVKARREARRAETA
jgi:membrane-associated protein